MYTFQDLIDHFKDDPLMVNRLKYNKEAYPVTHLEVLSPPHSLAQCLYWSFYFKETPEGINYWVDVYVKLLELDL